MGRETEQPRLGHNLSRWPVRGQAVLTGRRGPVSSRPRPTHARATRAGCSVPLVRSVRTAATPPSMHGREAEARRHFRDTRHGDRGGVPGWCTGRALSRELSGERLPAYNEGFRVDRSHIRDADGPAERQQAPSGSERLAAEDRASGAGGCEVAQRDAHARQGGAVLDLGCAERQRAGLDSGSPKNAARTDGMDRPGRVRSPA